MVEPVDSADETCRGRGVVEVEIGDETLIAESGADDTVAVTYGETTEGGEENDL